MKDEEFEMYQKWFIGLLPKNLSNTVRCSVEGDIISQLIRLKDAAINDFCKRHNLCPMCITGGYNCDSDHK